MRNVVLKNITDKADALAREYNRTKDPKLKAQWFSLVSSVEPPPSHIQTSVTVLKTPPDLLQKHRR